MDIRIILNWIIIATVPFLLGNNPEMKFSGNFTTEHIRELWQMCSIAHQQARVDPAIYYPHCDCAVDTMRENYDNATVFQYMDKTESNKLSALVRLKCNEWRIKGARE
jgi:hypothetical protein